MNKILKEEIELIKLDESELRKIKKISREFILGLKKDLEKKKILASVFVGGSLAKKTLVKKKVLDVDIFVRFDKKYDSNKISGILAKVLGSKIKKIHGSRDYFQIKEGEIVLEIIPVMKVSKPDNAFNITDLSYFHVNYFLKKLKGHENLSSEIMLAKKFSQSCNCYGAESYINGFSGYALELLIVHYGSFLKFVKAVVKMDDKVVIDDFGFYKSKKDILEHLNKSKLKSPIILIDPTFKDRNALAGLSDETFFKFKKCCKAFLAKSSHEFFKSVDVEKDFLRFKDLRVVEVVTNKQIGDIAGTKSKKFFRFFLRRVEKEFVVRKNGFSYNEGENVARFYLVLDSLGDGVLRGPPVGSSGVKGFKKVHSGTFVSKGFVCVNVKHDLEFKDWFKWFVKKEKKVMKEMCVEGLELMS
jgi:tRNA CCA-adding enzyme